jgi:hypothetical protein
MSTRASASHSSTWPLEPSSTLSCTPGCVARIWANRRPTRGRPMEGSTPRVTRPTSSRASLRISASSRPASLSSALTCGKMRWPMSDSSSPRPVRLNSRVRHSRSSALSWRLSSDWLLSSTSAARVRLPTSAMAMKARHLCRSAAMSSWTAGTLGFCMRCCRGGAPDASTHLGWRRGCRVAPRHAVLSPCGTLILQVAPSLRYRAGRNAGLSLQA